jgi:hypothetical protein
MKKTAIKLFQFYNLDSELNGIVDQKTNQVTRKGLLSERLSLVLKYWLMDLAKKAFEEKNACESMKEELIRKYGEMDELGNISLLQYTNVVKDENGEVLSIENNPKFEEFQVEWNQFLNEEKEVEHKEFKLSDFENVESEDVYPALFNLVITKE